MPRLTEPEGDYCRDVCRCKRTCQRLQRGQHRCSDADRYERLREYENTGLSPEEIGQMRTVKKG